MYPIIASLAEKPVLLRLLEAPALSRLTAES
jgi:hypothetical protein